MNFDQIFLGDVLQTIKKYYNSIKSIEMRMWIDEIEESCKNFISDLSKYNGFYENTYGGEVVSDMIWQYHCDENFQNSKLMRELCMLAEHRDEIIQNHQYQIL